MAVSVPLLAGACNGGVERGPVARPPIGLAVRDSAGAWCAEFPTGSAPSPTEGSAASLVFVGDTTWVSSSVRIRGRRASDCPTAFPQPRWSSYAAYDVDLADAKSRQDSLPYLALIIGGDTHWVRGSNGTVHGDIDGDRVAEEIRRCAADGGEHFTVWSTPRSGPPVRHAHEYFDWGALVDPTCKPGEDGRDVEK
jgi:hypothetical protein